MAENGSVVDSRAGRRRWILVLGIAGAVCAAYVAGRRSHSYPQPRDIGAGRVLYYVDPMHPAYRSDKPGKAPDCGMDLEPVYADGRSGRHPAMSSGSVRLTPDQEQAARLETETMHTAPGEHTVHTVGRVAADEAQSYSVSAGVDGWVRRVFSDQTGTQVRRGEPLAAFYSKDISASQQAYVYALESYERLKRRPSPPAEQLALAAKQLAAARDDLHFLGMGDSQIEELGRTRAEIFDVDVTAPVDGLILERRVATGQRFLKGELLYRIANLKRVWVLAEIQPGDSVFDGSLGKACVRVEGLPPLEARVSGALPQFDEQGRIGKLRLEVNNPHNRLIPGMIVNVDLNIRGRPAITVHADAVIDSGISKHVFVGLGEGDYELREVETGRQEGDRVEIRSGLKAGERVVTSGAFLLDSESRMKNSAHEWKATDNPVQ